MDPSLDRQFALRLPALTRRQQLRLLLRLLRLRLRRRTFYLLTPSGKWHRL